MKLCILLNSLLLATSIFADTDNTIIGIWKDPNGFISFEQYGDFSWGRSKFDWECFVFDIKDQNAYCFWRAIEWDVLSIEKIDGENYILLISSAEGVQIDLLKIKFISKQIIELKSYISFNDKPFVYEGKQELAKIIGPESGIIINMINMMKIDGVVTSDTNITREMILQSSLGSKEVNKGDTLSLLQRSFFKYDDNYYYLVETENGKQGWIYGKFIEVVNYKIGVINAPNLRFRTKPNLNADMIEYLQTGQKVEILGQTEEKMQISDLNDYWYNIRTSDGTEGWAYGHYIDVEETE